MNALLRTGMLKFHATWCGPCHALEPRIKEIQEETGVQVVCVDVDNSPDLAIQYRIRAMPTVVFLRDGVEVNRVEGNHPDKIHTFAISLLKNQISLPISTDATVKCQPLATQRSKS